MEKSNIGFLFAGQGTQTVGMGQDFYEVFPQIRAFYESHGLDFDLKDLCFKGPQTLLDRTEYAQPAILLTSFVIASVLSSYGLKPRMIAGFSLGEYSALAYAQALSLQRMLRLVHSRGQWMSDVLAGRDTAMFALINLKLSDVHTIIEQARSVGICDIASINCPGQIVISGDVQALNLARKHVKERGGLAVKLNVSGAFHSRCLTDAEEPLRRLLEKEIFYPPVIDIIQNVTGALTTVDPVENLVRQMTSTVQFEASIRTMIACGITTFVEIGPGSVLSGFVRKIDATLNTFSVYDIQSLQRLLEGMP